MNKKIWIYDIEIFPNFFSVIFIDRDSEETKEFIIYNKTNDLTALNKFIKTECYFLVGYNSSKYDNIIINFLIKKEQAYYNESTWDITAKLYELSQEIIDSQNGGKSIYWNSKLKPYLWTNYYLTIDLMSLMAFDKNKVSLKQAGIAMRWHKIQDLPKPFNEPVKDDEMKLIMDYNMNDVLMTKQLLMTVISELSIRKNVGEMYGVNLWSSSRSSVADKLMSKFWSDETRTEYKDFKELRTTYDSIKLSELISDKVKFKSKKLNDLLDTINNKILMPGNKFKQSVIIGESKYDMLLGGLHSNNPPMVVEEDSETELHDADFSSYYPYLMITLGAFPKHLSKVFLDLFKRLVEQRLEAKRKGNKVVANALKIVINSTYGKLNFEHGWLYDSKAAYKVTLNGQLFLFMLIEKLEKVGLKVYYANTDGFMTKVPKNRVEEYKKICKEFEDYVKIPLEFEKYSKCTIRDVNNFTMITSSGSIKEKGAFVRDMSVVSTFLRPNYTCSYDMPVIAKALYSYFHKNIPIENTIKANTDIYDFCKAQKIGGQYTAEYHTLNEAKTDLVINKCQKSNRYYVSTTQSKLYKKRKDTGKLADLCAGYNVELFNDYIDKKDYKINYSYYITAAQKIIDVMEPKQLKLF